MPSTREKAKQTKREKMLKKYKPHKLVPNGTPVKVHKEENYNSSRLPLPTLNPEYTNEQ